MKNILVITDNLNHGGIAKIVTTLSKELNKHGYKIDYATYIPLNEMSKKHIESIDANVYIIKRIREVNPIEYMSQISKILKNKKYDIVHLHTANFIWLAGMVAKKHKIKAVGHAHGAKGNDQGKIVEKLHPVFKFLNRLVCDEMIACAENSGEWTFGKGKYTFIPNFVDDEEIKKSDQAYNNNSDGKMLKMCFIGYLGGEKNPIFALELLEFLLKQGGNYFLDIAGDGPEKELLEKIATEKNISKNIEFHGNTDEVYRIMKQSNLLIMPSFSEGMSMALLEAQLLGINCIVSQGVLNTTDLNLNLFHQCESYDFTEWNNKIKQVIQKKCKEYTYQERIEEIKKLGYHKEQLISKIIELYEQ